MLWWEMTQVCGNSVRREGRLSRLTPLILTYNEEPNISRCLAALAWAKQIIVVDSGSTDRTLKLIARHPQTRVAYRAFDAHAAQANFALGLVETPWVLSLDADYILTPEFEAALREGEWREDEVYFARFQQCVRGRPLRRSLYPPRAVLFARAGAGYAQDGHTQRLILGGRKQVLLPGYIIHDDRKSAKRWRQNQRNYAELEAAKLMESRLMDLDLADRLRRTGWLGPVLIGPYVLFICGTVCDGWPGFLYAIQRVYFETLLAWRLIRNRLAPRIGPRPVPVSIPFP